MTKAQELAESYKNGNIKYVSNKLKRGSKKLLLDFAELVEDSVEEGIKTTRRLINY